MTESEAKKEIEHNVFCNTDNFEMTISKECYKTIINALENQIPKKPDRWESGHACCCSCKRGIVREDNYCCYCGQRIDWSDEG